MKTSDLRFTTYPLRQLLCGILVLIPYSLLLIPYSSIAIENIPNTHAAAKKPQKLMTAGCPQDVGAAFLNINNVRCRIMDEGDMWWDPGANCDRYYVPAAGNISAQFAAAIWIGGLDAGGQLKIAAMTYRQNGEDFWAGPIDTSTGSISLTECQSWDRMFYVTKQEVATFHANYPNGTVAANIPSDILNWPGSGHSGFFEPANLAPWVANPTYNDVTYTPENGDYPDFDLSGNEGCQNVLYGDACLWWVFNDEGNIHTETGGVPIGVEVRAQAFAFATNDAINNMTFYHYQVVNRSSFTLNQTYFGFFDDFDLGNGEYNWTGCDVKRKMGYGYDGTGSATAPGGAYECEGTYGLNYPAVGVVFFQGPEADAGDKSKYIDTVNGIRCLGLARFVYYRNDFTVQGNPTNQTAYYNYLRGEWTDGTPMTWGGTGYGGTVACNYMFPWTPSNSGNVNSNTNTDLTWIGTNGVPQPAWNCNTAAVSPADMRFIESAGPFTLQPGAVNYVILGCVFDQPSAAGNGFYFPITLIQQDADLAQALFNNCFKVVSGPNAPDLTVQELNQELILTLSNPNIPEPGNNYKELYGTTFSREIDASIPAQYKNDYYTFQGYEVFQLLDSSVTAAQLTDNTQARLVAECDIQDTVSGSIANWVKSTTVAGALNATQEVNCANKGIVHSFDIKSDLFSEDGISTLVNDRPYYYMVIAFAYNNYAAYISGPPASGQPVPFLQGKNNIRVYTAYPHIPEAQNYGTVQNSVYGEGIPVTRLEGHGNGNNTIELDQNSINYILANNIMANPTYLPGAGPINVKVVDPLNVINSNFIVKFIKGATAKGMDTSATWELIVPPNSTNPDTVVISSDKNIAIQYEQIFPQYGISITLQDVQFPNYSVNGAIDSTTTLTFANPQDNWLGGVPSAGPGLNPLNWIRSGSFVDQLTTGGDKDNAYSSNGPGANGAGGGFYDPNQYYNKFLNGEWAPYTLCAVSDNTAGDDLYCDNGPSYGPVPLADSIGNLASVDIVFTADQSKWTRCVVFEEQDYPTLAMGGALKMHLRASYSVDQYGNYAKSGSVAEYTDPSQANFISPTGMGWFPGYAINVETGERLNMAFGEDSWLNGDNGRDMKWNPDSIIQRQCGNGSDGVCQFFGQSSVFGGKHYIYVFGHNNNYGTNKATQNYSVPAYDYGKHIDSVLQLPTPTASTGIFNTTELRLLQDIMWVGIPLLNAGHQLLETDATVRLRVAKPYDTSYGETYLNKNGSGGAKAIIGSTWRNPNPQNNNYPMYSFTTNGLGVATANMSAAQNALSLINVVPNPYYAYSGYETDRLDTRVRITNLPPKCTISIFTVSGTLVTVINKDNPQTYTDWNLQNQYNVPIAGGLYLINVRALMPDNTYGEVTLKWFGVMRPIDLNSY